MKPLNILVFAALVSCATRAPLTYKQECGYKGMVLAGVNTQSGTVSGSAYNWKTNSTSYNDEYYEGESVQCVVPKNKKEACEAEVYGQAAAPLNEYNSGYQGKKFLTGLGYYALILPGVGLKFYYDGQRDKAVYQAKEIEKDALYSCSNEREIASEK